MAAVKQSQIAYQLKLYNQSNKAPRKISLNDLVGWANQHSARPIVDDEPFVTKVGYETEPLEFRVYITTRRLSTFSQQVRISKTICFLYAFFSIRFPN